MLTVVKWYLSQWASTGLNPGQFLSEALLTWWCQKKLVQCMTFEQHKLVEPHTGSDLFFLWKVHLSSNNWSVEPEKLAHPWAWVNMIRESISFHRESHRHISVLHDPKLVQYCWTPVWGCHQLEDTEYSKMFLPLAKCSQLESLLRAYRGTNLA